IFYIHHIEKVSLPVKNRSYIEVGRKVDDYNIQEFSELLKICRLAPYPVNLNSSQPIQNSVKAMKKHFLFFSRTTKGSKKLMKLEDPNKLFKLMCKPTITDAEYSTCETVGINES
ncbi:hypothetical protein HZS_854, partial [Henneguya salminicola]